MSKELIVSVNGRAKKIAIIEWQGHGVLTSSAAKTARASSAHIYKDS